MPSPHIIDQDSEPSVARSSSSPALPVSSEMKFETALAELEQIVQSMESGRLSLEDAVTTYHRGSELLKHCQKQLSDAEHEIQVLDNGMLRSFDSSPAESP